MQGEYSFPTERISVGQRPNKTPTVLVACGSFSPITFLHLRMFEMARDHANFNTDFEIVAGYMSPVNDRYLKPGLAADYHRYNMCALACSKTSDWLMVDPWEARQPEYVPTAKILDHFDHELNQVRGGVDVQVEDEQNPGSFKIEKRKARIVLLAGSDLIQTMSEPGVWAEKDLHHILGLYGCFIIERSESEIDQSLFSSSSVHSRSPLALYRHNIYMVGQLVRNDVSSTKIRLFLKKGMSAEYLLPGIVIKYIKRNGLYQEKDGADGRNGAIKSVSSNPVTRTPSPAPSLRPVPAQYGNNSTSTLEAAQDGSRPPSPRTVATRIALELDADMSDSELSESRATTSA